MVHIIIRCARQAFSNKLPILQHLWFLLRPQFCSRTEICDQVSSLTQDEGEQKYYQIMKKIGSCVLSKYVEKFPIAFARKVIKIQNGIRHILEKFGPTFY